MLWNPEVLCRSTAPSGGTLSAIRHAWHLDRAAADGAAQIPRPTSPEEQRRLTKAAVAAPVTVVSMTGNLSASLILLAIGCQAIKLYPADCSMTTWQSCLLHKHFS